MTVDQIIQLVIGVMIALIAYFLKKELEKADKKSEKTDEKIEDIGKSVTSLSRTVLENQLTTQAEIKALKVKSESHEAITGITKKLLEELNSKK